jgi:uncharacterized protein (TIGR03435 family)
MTNSLLRGICAGLVLAAGAALGQTPAAGPAFEVASIKAAGPLDPSRIRSGQMHLGMRIDAARVDIGSMSLADLIQEAYRLKPYQISGPGWMTSERFDVLAKMPEGASREQVPEMLQALLAERFKLAVHRETKEHAMYALLVGKSGPKLTESPPDADAPAGRGENAQATIAGGRMGVTRMSAGPGGGMHLELSKMTMARFAEILSRYLSSPVVDLTELKGTYQMALDLSMEDLLSAARTAGYTVPGLGGGGDAARQPADAASDPGGLSILGTLQQLGLRLEPRKAPMEMIVIDHVEKAPTEN